MRKSGPSASSWASWTTAAFISSAAQAAVEAARERFVGAHIAPGQQQFGGQALADDARQMAQAPMSQPARPTRVNKNAVFRDGVLRRMSEDMARIAPAPAHTPSTAAMMGCGQARMARTKSPVMRVKLSSSGMLMRVNGPMISWTSAGAKIAAGARDHDHFTSEV